jgi:RNA polymerase sigma-70 factor (ECF subfamily)
VRIFRREIRNGGSAVAVVGEGAPPGVACTDEATTMRAVATGDLAAYETVYDAHARVVYGLCLRMLGDPGAAEDATQEVFLRIWRGAARFDPARGSLRTWVVAIAHRHCLDRLRARRPGQAAAAEALEWLSDPAPAPAEQAERSVEAARVRGALAALQPDQRRALTLMYFGGYSQSEIAAALGVPLGTVKSRARLGLQALRRWMAAEGAGAGDGA